jgi:hypothetical protein
MHVARMYEEMVPLWNGFPPTPTLGAVPQLAPGAFFEEKKMAYTCRDFLWGQGPEYEAPEETQQERLMRLMDCIDHHEMQTSILENNNQMLADLIKKWRQ